MEANSQEHKEAIENSTVSRQKSRKISFRKIGGFLFRHRTKIAYIIILLLIGTLLYLGLNQDTPIESKITKFGLRDIGELATQAGYFTGVQKIHKSREVLGVEVPLTDSNYIFTYDGVVKAGVDFTEATVTVDEEQFLITISLPEVHILSLEIDQDSFELLNDGKNIFTSLSVEEVNSSIAELKTKATEAAIDNGLFDGAKRNAELLVKGFLSSLYDMNTYSVTFEWRSEDEG